MLSSIFHTSPRSAISAAMREVQTFGGADEELDFGAFAVCCHMHGPFLKPH